ncbi:phosphoribosylamine--glycine ligase [Bifidobacterium gallicum]|uniref:Phosphoribosylamine--glycine ligase n=1 Tax=Bifidobacterium gallicum DSM 20093 = LMG 11596 TaxID=561180 RepID=D1NUP4_9BIFI|nr:phosphoribosylamine--glycine ligase [Bifidobacterium gallicum]EFA22545.1 phosphoribosylamine--glycine ligase [Bifidobacterium gallicum DSM 20093 = LMG 11596]KFI59535.1 phosphoribosylamine--glycine ligase [Bifidobacterium gallicum DSM 20093 = LMG 11596]
MKILVIGSGAREHTIASTLLASDHVSEVAVVPGNPGMERDGLRVVNLNPKNQAGIIEFVQNNGYDWVFVGPEVPLIEGIVDSLAEAGIPAFGPSKQAAQIEGSKDFAKRLMERHNIPTAAYATFSELEPAVAYVREHGAPIVIKADGLAAGKGVTVAMDEQTAIDALNDIFLDHKFGIAGAKVVIEEFLEGQEFSLMSFVHGTKFWPMPISQDHKRAYDNDEGPNTGGMGAYSPVPQIPQSVVDEAIETIVKPTVEAMDADGIPFTGILYAGLIATADGPKVIEFNARFGDPETEVVLPLLTSDLAMAINDLLVGKEPEFTWDESAATLGVVLASDGYPEDVIKGAAVPDIAVDDDSHVYYAGVAVAGKDAQENETGLVGNSGRVMFVQTKAPTLAQAQRKVYELIPEQVPGMFYRHDIGAKALKG